MGSIRVREGRHQANVRRKGYPTVTKTFTSREVAKRWIKTTEIAIEKGEYSPKISITVAEMLVRYKLICLATHKGADVSEQYRIKLLTNYFGALPLCDRTPAHLARFRDSLPSSHGFKNLTQTMRRLPVINRLKEFPVA